MYKIVIITNQLNHRILKNNNNAILHFKENMSNFVYLFSLWLFWSQNTQVIKEQSFLIKEQPGYWFYSSITHEVLWIVK